MLTMGHSSFFIFWPQFFFCCTLLFIYNTQLGSRVATQLFGQAPPAGMVPEAVQCVRCAAGSSSDMKGDDRRHHKMTFTVFFYSFLLVFTENSLGWAILKVCLLTFLKCALVPFSSTVLYKLSKTSLLKVHTDDTKEQAGDITCELMLQSRARSWRHCKRSGIPEVRGNRDRKDATTALL